jgi:hypothetical protein
MFADTSRVENQVQAWNSYEEVEDIASMGKYETD